MPTVCSSRGQSVNSVPLSNVIEWRQAVRCRAGHGGLSDELCRRVCCGLSQQRVFGAAVDERQQSAAARTAERSSVAFPISESSALI